MIIESCVILHYRPSTASCLHDRWHRNRHRSEPRTKHSSDPPSSLHLIFVVFTQNLITVVWGQCVMNYCFYHGSIGDPLSLATGIAELISLGLEVTKITRQYVQDVRSAAKDVGELLTELSALVVVLRN